MASPTRLDLDRRSFVVLGLKGVALASLPAVLPCSSRLAQAADRAAEAGIEAVVRPATLFAGIRKPIKERAQLEPRIATLERVCKDRITGPLTHIYRYDTPVDGLDSEIGFPVSEPINTGEVKTHTLREMHFYSTMHEGAPDTLRDTAIKLYQYMGTTGLSAELELAEVFHHRDNDQPSRSRTQVMASFLPWPEVYRRQLDRVLGVDAAEAVFSGGDRLTPHTLVDERCAWVAATIARLKKTSTVDQQFDILSRVALLRPAEDTERHRRIYQEAGNDPEAVIKAQQAKLEQTRFGGFIDRPRFDSKVLHLSKPPYNMKAYKEAGSHADKRRAYCFCNVVREAADPQIDPIFCYRAAGWARQFWEPILGVEFTRCTITHSILKGDDFCAWDFHMPTA